MIPYDQRMARFPAYLQQLDMESNGKSVDARRRAGRCVATAPVVLGEPGTNGQHAFFQLLHQGTEIVPIDFLIAAEPTAADEKHHRAVVRQLPRAERRPSCSAARSRRSSSQLEAQDLSPEAIAALAPHKLFEGDRPSSTFLYRQLTPRTLGRLIALYEHKVFVQGVIWNINSFDQWGVELGKELAMQLAPIVADASLSTAGLDSSTAGLIEARRRLERN